MVNYEQIALNRYGNEFLSKLKKIAQNLKVDYYWLLGVMYSESGINHQAQNRYNQNGTFDTGLIQFNDVTAEYLGTSRNALMNMSALNQLDYVEKYYKPVAGKVKCFGNLYLYNYAPAYFYNLSSEESKRFTKQVTDRYIKDTGKNPCQNTTTGFNIKLDLLFYSLLITIAVVYIFKNQIIKL